MNMQSLHAVNVLVWCLYLKSIMIMQHTIKLTTNGTLEKQTVSIDISIDEILKWLFEKGFFRSLNDNSQGYDNDTSIGLMNSNFKYLCFILKLAKNEKDDLFN